MRAASHNPGVNCRCPMFHIYCLVNLLNVHNVGCASFSHKQASNYHNIRITRKALKSTSGFVRVSYLPLIPVTFALCLACAL